MTEDESKPLLRFLFEHSVRPERTSVALPLLPLPRTATSIVRQAPVCPKPPLPCRNERRERVRNSESGVALPD